MACVLSILCIQHNLRIVLTYVVCGKCIIIIFVACVLYAINYY